MPQSLSHRQRGHTDRTQGLTHLSRQATFTTPACLISSRNLSSLVPRFRHNSRGSASTTASPSVLVGATTVRGGGASE